MFPSDTRVLVIEDMMSIRTMIKGAVQEIGFSDVLEASNGQEALEILLRERAANKPVGLILSDWRMPKMSGLELLQALRQDSRYQDQFKDVPFIMVTAEGEATKVRDAAASGVSGYIVKPFTGELLAEKLEMVWQRIAR